MNFVYKLRTFKTSVSVNGPYRTSPPRPGGSTPVCRHHKTRTTYQPGRRVPWNVYPLSSNQLLPSQYFRSCYKLIIPPPRKRSSSLPFSETELGILWDQHHHRHRHHHPPGSSWYAFCTRSSPSHLGLWWCSTPRRYTPSRTGSRRQASC